MNASRALGSSRACRPWASILSRDAPRPGLPWGTRRAHQTSCTCGTDVSFRALYPLDALRSLHASLAILSWRTRRSRRKRYGSNRVRQRCVVVRQVAELLRLISQRVLVQLGRLLQGGQARKDGVQARVCVETAVAAWLHLDRYREWLILARLDGLLCDEKQQRLVMQTPHRLPSQSCQVLGSLRDVGFLHGENCRKHLVRMRLVGADLELNVQFQAVRIQLIFMNLGVAQVFEMDENILLKGHREAFARARKINLRGEE